ncbi:MAG: phosphatase PAP2 family protein [Candidatus Omnitrophica bacterium]|nr:phosphatase PAP2 family protein [Candidatus Omnitrophota bacterium]
MLDHLDHQIGLGIKFILNNKGCDWAMPLISGSAEGVTLTLLALFLLLSRNRKDKMTAILILAGMTLTYHLVGMIKESVCRLRPFVTFPDVHAMVPASGFSFPSGHTAFAFMTAYLLTFRFGKGKYFYPFAALVGLSRIYLGVHYLTDVIAGAVVGICAGYVLMVSTRQLFAET